MALIGRPPCDEGAVLYGAAAPPCSAAARRWTLVAAILGSSMAFIDGTVVNVALPAIQHDLRATARQAQWVIESYALVPGGAAAGRRRAGRSLRAPARSSCSAWRSSPLASIGCALVAQRAAADRGARGARRRRGAAGAGQPGADQRHVSRGRARPRDRHLVGLQRHHRRARARWSAASWSITARGPGPSSSTCRWRVVLLSLMPGARCRKAAAARRGRAARCRGRGARDRRAWAASCSRSSRRRRAAGTSPAVLARAGDRRRGLALLRRRREPRAARRCCRSRCFATATSPAPTC